MPGYTFDIIPGGDIDDEQLRECANLFSENYGFYSSTTPKAGSRVKMGVKTLSKHCLGKPEQTAVAICKADGLLVGQAFATVWDSETDRVGWVTQLVVEKSYRRKGVATRMLRELKDHPLFDEVSILGIASTHPVACDVMAKMGGVPIGHVDTAFIARNAPRVLSGTHVEYLRQAELCGAIFGDGTSPAGVVSLVNTRFPVDHAEPLEVLKTYVERGKWCLGDLLAGHEFLVVVPN